MQRAESCRIAARFVLALASLLMSAAACADWKTYDSTQYGFSMLIPAGAGVATRESGAWGGIAGSFEGLRIIEVPG